MLGWENLFHCEINPFGRQVLDYWYPNSKSYEDITTTDFTEWRGRVDVLTGGFPCQPFSYAGRRRGAEDDRYLWPSMYRAIDEIQPTWVVAENVAGILTMVEQGEVSKVAGSATLFDAFDDLRGRFELRETFTLQRICTDLESHGYAVQPVLVPACAVGAPHRRDRVFIVARRMAADSEHVRLQHDAGRGKQTADTKTQSGGGQDVLSEQIQRIATVSKGKCPTETEVRPIADTADGRVSGFDTHGEQCDEGIARQSQQDCEPCASGNPQGRHEDDGRGIGTGTLDVVPDTDSIGRRSGRLCGDSQGHGQTENGLSEALCCGHIDPDGRERQSDVCGERWRCFPSVSPVHRGNDGLPFDVDRLTLSFGKWRTEALKAYGNAIVPQVMYEIFRAIEIVEQTTE